MNTFKLTIRIEIVDNFVICNLLLLVVILPLGKWDARMAVEDGKIEQLVSYITFFFESIMKAIRESGGKPGHPNTQFSIIVDWDGYSFKQFTNIKGTYAN